jgi:prepilin peptidase CpaA
MEGYYVLLAALIIIAFYTDATRTKLPNWLTLSGAVSGLLYHLIFFGWNGLMFSLIGGLVGFAVMLILYLFKAMEAGDVKLFAAIGTITGIEFVLYCMMYAIVFAGMIGVFILAFKKYKKHRRFPFMYAVLPAVFTTCFYYVV